MTLLDLLPQFYTNSVRPRQVADQAEPPGKQQSSARLAPLSPEQQRYWFLAQLAPESAADHLAVALRLRGPLAQARLERSFQHVLNRHEALRTLFTSNVGQPKQYVVPHLEFPFLLTDSQDSLPAERPEKIRALLAAEIEAPFALEQRPLIRGHLLRVAADEHVLLLVGHALVVDRRSLRLLIAEMAARYNGQNALPLPICQYADFQRRQKTWQQPEAGQAARRYWAQQLTDSQPLLELPTDHPRPPYPSLRANSHPLTLDAEYRLLASLACDHYPPQLLLLAAWAILLFRYTGQGDLSLGAGDPNRGEEDHTVVGPCHNQLVLRTRMTAEQTGRQLLDTLHKTMVEAQRQGLPFAEVVNQVQPVREISHTPLFQVLFLWETAPAPPPFTELAGDWLDLPVTATRYDLTLSLTRTGHDIAGKIIYNTSLFAAATIARMAAQYQQLLGALLDDLDEPIGRLSLLPPGQRQRLLHLWNDTEMTYAQNRCIHHYFEMQAARTPAQAALYANGRFWQYQELNERANRLAHYLVAQGIQPGDLVGVCLGRSADLLIALLAILKAGAAYVPLDPAYPAARIAYILEDAGVALLLTETTLPQSPATSGQPCLPLAEAADTINAQPTHNLRLSLPASSLAYVIYTSGSTGQPKGVEITHRNTGAFISWARAQFSDAELKAVLAATSICFDLSIFELFVPLSSGGMVVLVQNILELVDHSLPVDVTLVNTVPSAAAELVEAGVFPPSVQTVNLAGEPFHYRLVHQLYGQGVDRVYNLYGPSEYTTYTTCALLDADGPENGRPPIGRPIANTQIYLLDDQQQPAPVGVIGEIYIGGDGLARGYRGRPGLTRQKFIPNPFSPQQRLYRTGDLARYRPDGQLEFIGREDHQIKLRGYRIELGEIETVLEQHPAVQETAVAVRRQTPDTLVLVAYLATDEPQAAKFVFEIRRFLAQKLPNYMVPAHFQVVAALPRTPNGKIDRQKLPDDYQTATGSGRLLDPDDETIEARLRQIWQEVLGVPLVSTTDDFFELGGNSLLAVRLMARIEQEFGQKLPLSTLF